MIVACVCLDPARVNIAMVTEARSAGEMTGWGWSRSHANIGDKRLIQQSDCPGPGP